MTDRGNGWSANGGVLVHHKVSWWAVIGQIGAFGGGGQARIAAAGRVRAEAS
ncbi:MULTISPECIES: hypothetical protein [Kitasatospora]